MKKIMPSPIDCNECNLGFHPNHIYDTKENKKICASCLMRKRFLNMGDSLQKNTEIEDFEVFFRKILTDDSLQRFKKNIK